ncbi:alkaline phosphatase [Afifella sp. IM 167]|nr:alkaline phosphatase [Afifella sp. IM 167]MBZ8134565.1 alkaline phosphatase [Afifella sp. IM 167]
MTTLGLALTSGVACAQDNIAQSGSSWFTDAQAELQARIDHQPNTNRAKNVILFIADGMGVGTNYAIRLYAGQQEGQYGSEHVLPYEAYGDFPNVALVKTYNINAQTPDSAPTAGSMNTGVKQVFNTINLSDKAIHDDCASEAGNKLTLFSELMSDAGKSVGVVSTARLTHATPAAAFAKTANRNWEGEAPEGCTDIAAQLLEQMKAGVVDLAMGGGRRYFLPADATDDEGKKGRRKDARNLIDEAKEAGMQYAWNTETAGGLNLDGETPVLALFEDSHMKYEHDRTDADEPSLTDMTKMAIDYLSKNEDGYYLEIESGRVDHANHDGNAFRTVTDGVEFARAVAAAAQMTNAEDTLIIVTADHEHSIALNGYCGRGSPILGLCYEVAKGQVEHAAEPVLGDDGKPFTVIGFLNGPGAVLKKAEGGNDYSGSRPELTEEEASDPEYIQQALIPMSSESHSGEDVAVWARGPWAHLFDGVIEQNYIFHVMNHAANAE